MKMGQGLVLLALVVGVLKSEAKPKTAKAPVGTGKNTCEALTAELRAMREAQNTLLQNMVQSNDTMADTLEQYAGEFQESSKRRKPISAQDLTSLKQSAEAFRAHKAREQKLVSQFDMASAKLISKVETCLK